MVLDDGATSDSELICSFGFLFLMADREMLVRHGCHAAPLRLHVDEVLVPLSKSRRSSTHYDVIN